MKKTAYLIIFALLSAACSKMLEIPQHGVLDTDTYYKTDADAAAAVTAVYEALAGGAPGTGQGTGLYTLELTYGWINGYLSDEYWTAYNARSEGLDNLVEYSFDANHSEILNHYMNLYNVVGKCNLVIENLKGDTAFQRQAIAEAKVVRAWMYFELTTLWGTPPIVDHVMSASEPAPTNATQEELWAFMEKDLKDAIESGALTQKSSVGDRTNYRITKQYAQAWLGKVYLWQKKYDEAAAVLEEVVAPDKRLYALTTGNYGDIYGLENENGPESMFETNRILDTPYTPTSFFPTFFGLCIYTRGMTFTDETNPLGLPKICFGGFAPRGSVYKAFEDEANAESGPDARYRIDQTIKTYQFMKDAGYPIADAAVEFSEGYFQWKGRYLANQMDPETMVPCHRNIRWMRFAEVLLMAAEANCLKPSPDQAKADTYLNEVRSRVKMSPKTCTLETIQNERRLELFGDFIRYKDLQRWGIAKDVLKDQGKEEPTIVTDGTVTWKNYSDIYGYKEGKHEYLPFPHAEILANKNMHQHDAWK